MYSVKEVGVRCNQMQRVDWKSGGLTAHGQVGGLGGDDGGSESDGAVGW